MLIRPKPGSRVPGTLFLGSLGPYRRDPLKLFLDSALESPDIVQFRMGHKSLFLLIDPRYIRPVLLENQRNYVKGVS